MTRAIDLQCPTCGVPADHSCVTVQAPPIRWRDTFHKPRIKAAVKATRDANRARRARSV
jgi:hypothetical protein